MERPPSCLSRCRTFVTRSSRTEASSSLRSALASPGCESTISLATHGSKPVPGPGTSSMCRSLGAPGGRRLPWLLLGGCGRTCTSLLTLSASCWSRERAAASVPFWRNGSGLAGLRPFPIAVTARCFLGEELGLRDSGFDLGEQSSSELDVPLADALPPKKSGRARLPEACEGLAKLGRWVIPSAPVRTIWLPNRRSFEKRLGPALSEAAFSALVRVTQHNKSIITIPH
mmetsp:Transcript_111986/g.327495  ORF Transcript_111986/g.327495 Transcript_111986/m.327495 type:complete len:229 (-) Transcript_111986:36-722(-)